MKKIEIKTVSDKVILFIHQDGWNQNLFANEIDIPSRTLSNRIKLNNWHPDEERKIKRLFNRRGYEW